jgi:hypothetical protein
MFAIASPLAISGIPTSSGDSDDDDMGVDGTEFCGEPRNGCGRDGSVKTIAAIVRKQEMIEGKGKLVYRMSSLLFNRDLVVANQTPTAPDVSGPVVITCTYPSHFKIASLVGFTAGY